MFAAFSYTGTSYRVRGTKHITMDHIFNGTFGAQSQTLRWVPEGGLLSSLLLILLTHDSAGDGVFATTIDGHIALVDLKTNSTRNLVSMGDIKDVRVMFISLHSSYSYFYGCRNTARLLDGVAGNCRRTCNSCLSRLTM